MVAILIFWIHTKCNHNVTHVVLGIRFDLQALPNATQIISQAFQYEGTDHFGPTIIRLLGSNFKLGFWSSYAFQMVLSSMCLGAITKHLTSRSYLPSLYALGLTSPNKLTSGGFRSCYRGQPRLSKLHVEILACSLCLDAHQSINVVPNNDKW